MLQAFESNAAADFVADHCCSIYVNGGICTTQACKLCSERNKTIPEQKQEQERKEIERLKEGIRRTHREADVNKQLEARGNASDASKVQAGRNFQFLSRQLKPLLTDEQLESMRDTLRKVLGIESTSASAVFEMAVEIEVSSDGFGFDCDLEGKVLKVRPNCRLGMGQTLQVGSRVTKIAWTSGHGQLETIDLDEEKGERGRIKLGKGEILRDELEKMKKSGCQRAVLTVEMLETRDGDMVRAAETPPWLQNDHYLPAVPVAKQYYSGRDIGSGSQFGSAYDCCLIGWMLAAAGRAVTRDPWLLSVTAVVGVVHVAAGPWAVAGLLALLLALSFSGWLGGDVDGGGGGVEAGGGPAPRFRFDFSFLIQPTFSQFIVRPPPLPAKLYLNLCVRLEYHSFDRSFWGSPLSATGDTSSSSQTIAGRPAAVPPAAADPTSPLAWPQPDDLGRDAGRAALRGHQALRPWLRIARLWPAGRRPAVFL